MTPYSAAAGGQPLEPARARGRPPCAPPPGARARRAAPRSSFSSACSRVALAELLLDRLQLLAEEVLALALLQLGLHLRLDLRAELEHLQLAVQDQRDLAQPLLDVGQLEQLLLLLGLQPQRRGDEVAERARVVDVRGGELELLGQVRDEPDDAREERPGRCASAPRPRATPTTHVRDVLELADEVRARRRRARRAGRGAGPGRGCAASRRGPGSSCGRAPTVPTRRGRPSPAARRRGRGR